MEVILIRHGEPRYDEVEARGYFGMGWELGKLTERGKEQAEKVSNDPRLKGASIILSSPYTRALETAAIISRNTEIKIEVENDLHEWMPDITHKFIYNGQLAYEDYIASKGIRTNNHKYHWETYESLKERVTKAILKHKDLEKIIVVCHGIVMSSLTYFEDLIEHCGIREVIL
ncbi:histidine phosphatase family protein [Acholeplasma equirhinis]|uniref:histidine phosphatase family protein n=1 Tax=Acholeplasma equirhinis TaxID=555393 RepID=UPI00197ADD54|nr:histidine phosphatase family protein [Acholeplasma equirhinis]MBN3490599.1 histidine phosphatase family protein [Acholeplasma equirhinis]